MMGRPRLSDSQIRHTLDCYRKHKNYVQAAAALNINRSTVLYRLQIAKDRGWYTPRPRVKVRRVRKPLVGPEFEPGDWVSYEQDDGAFTEYAGSDRNYVVFLSEGTGKRRMVRRIDCRKDPSPDEVWRMAAELRAMRGQGEECEVA